MLKLFRTKTFIKDYRKIKFSDKLYAKYINYISMLLQEKELPLEAKNHSLKGEYKDYKEFHISGDLLIIYKVKNETLQLIRIGSHSELFK